MRHPDVTFIDTGDSINNEEIEKDQADDEFYTLRPKINEDNDPDSNKMETVEPKLLITTGYNPSFLVKKFIRNELLWLFPNIEYRPRKNYKIKEIIEFCKNRNFTALIILGERIQKPFELIISHLPDGPTATFRLSNIVHHDDLESPAERTEHYPELNFKNFDTRLGKRIQRVLESLFSTKRDYNGRAILTLHNQRDYIFLRVHRYMFNSMDEVRIQEMGPRITFRLLSLQNSSFDPKFGEYEWYRKKEHDSSKLEWYL